MVLWACGHLVLVVLSLCSPPSPFFFLFFHLFLLPLSSFSSFTSLLLPLFPPTILPTEYLNRANNGKVGGKQDALLPPTGPFYRIAQGNLKPGFYSVWDRASANHEDNGFSLPLAPAIKYMSETGMFQRPNLVMPPCRYLLLCRSSFSLSPFISLALF